LLDPDQPRSLDVLAGFGSFRLNDFARQHERGEDNLALDAAQSVAAVDQFFNLQVQTRSVPPRSGIL
jgi:hypothetical protein